MYHVSGISKEIQNNGLKLSVIVNPVICLMHPQQGVVIVLFHVCQPTQLKTVTS